MNSFDDMAAQQQVKPPQKSEPPCLQSKLMIFLSVDMVNSTAFKQSQQHLSEQTIEDHGGQSWFSPIAAFYHGMELLICKKWKKIFGSGSVDKPPKLWKAAGDELIYFKVLSNQKQARACVMAWVEAVSDHRVELKRKYPSLDLKAAAWLAGFPVNNAEIVLGHLTKDDRLAENAEAYLDDAIMSNLIQLDKFYSENSSGYSKNLQLDFIGPSMDTGFRICSLATPRKFALAIDLAYMFVVANIHENLRNPTDHDKTQKIKYDGRVQIKGVDGGNPYPFFWIDMLAEDTLTASEDILLPNVAIELEQIRKFCAGYFSRRGKEHGHIMLPYIADSNDELFKAIPEHHQSRRKFLIEKLNAHKQREIDGRFPTANHGDFGSNTLNQSKTRKAIGALQSNNQKPKGSKRKRNN